MVAYSAFIPYTVTLAFVLPTITCLEVLATAETDDTPEIFLISAISAVVKILELLMFEAAPHPTAPCRFPHVRRVRRLVPSDSILEVMLCCVPSPNAKRTITEVTPIIIQRLERSVRVLLTLILLSALTRCSQKDIHRGLGISLLCSVYSEV